MGEVRKLKLSELPKFKEWLLKRQKYICPLCGGSLVGVSDINRVVDHDHSKGNIRAVLHRGCNRAEGQVKQALATLGKAGTGNAGLVMAAERLLAFWSATPTDYIYPKHLSEPEKKAKANAAKRKAAATRRKA